MLSMVCNCDLFFDKIYADDTDHVKDFKYFNRFKSFAGVSDVINGKALGRENDSERIIAYNIGLSIHDINYAAHIYEMIKSDDQLFNKLQDINLEEPEAKFWV